jgi:diaminohydroxyphosphoribosylaminopyrimidine deaminase/5-amino-6-(5-phosphoribosylamino)uracil reductase
MPDLNDDQWLERAIELSRSCPPSATAFCVGAIIVSNDGEVLATGYSRETHPHDHAEEIALTKIPPDDPRLRTATIYTSLEPCSKRASRPRTCTELILAAGIPRVVLAWREPSIFVDCEGVELLTAAGVEVIELPSLAEQVKEINSHLLSG